MNLTPCNYPVLVSLKYFLMRKYITITCLFHEKGVHNKSQLINSFKGNRYIIFGRDIICSKLQLFFIYSDGGVNAISSTIENNRHFMFDLNYGFMPKAL